MAEALKARLMARVEAATLESEPAQESSQVRVEDAAHARAAAEAAEGKAKAQARAEEVIQEEARHREKASLDRSAQIAVIAEETALRLRYEKLRHERDQMQAANNPKAAVNAMAKPKATAVPKATAKPKGKETANFAQRSIDTASVVLSPFDQLQLAEDSDPDSDPDFSEKATTKAPALRAQKSVKKSATRGTGKKGVAFTKNVEQIEKDVAYYRAEIAAAEILGKHKTAEALYNEAKALGFELPHWQHDGARARQLDAGTKAAQRSTALHSAGMTKAQRNMTPAQLAQQEMDKEEDSEEEGPAPVVQAPVMQVMDRPEGASDSIEAAVEELGSTITIRLQHARYTTGGPGTPAVEGTLAITSSKKDKLVLYFSSKDRTKGNLKAKITTRQVKKLIKSEDDSDSGSDYEVDDNLVIAEFNRAGVRSSVSGTSGRTVCEVSIGGIVHGSIPGGDSLPEFRRTIQHLSQEGGNVVASRGGVQLVQSGVLCCPCQTQKNKLLVSPGGTDRDASFTSVQNGCSCSMEGRKLVCKLPGNAHARLEILIMFAYTAAALLTMPPK